MIVLWNLTPTSANLTPRMIHSHSCSTHYLESYGNCLNERFIFHLAILKGVARMGKYFSVSIEALAPKQPWPVNIARVLIHDVRMRKMRRGKMRLTSTRS